MTQREREEQRRQWWERLDHLYCQDDMIGFWSQYAEYLAWENVLSPQRRLLLAAADKTVEQLQDKSLTDLGRERLFDAPSAKDWLHQQLSELIDDLSELNDSIPCRLDKYGCITTAANMLDTLRDRLNESVSGH